MPGLFPFRRHRRGCQLMKTPTKIYAQLKAEVKREARRGWRFAREPRTRRATTEWALGYAAGLDWVAGRIDYLENPHKLSELFMACAKQDRALILKYAKDPNHKHVRELIGSFGPVGLEPTQRFYWCKICHIDMWPPLKKKAKVKRPVRHRSRSPLSSGGCAGDTLDHDAY